MNYRDQSTIHMASQKDYKGGETYPTNFLLGVLDAENLETGSAPQYLVPFSKNY